MLELVLVIWIISAISTKELSLISNHAIQICTLSILFQKFVYNKAVTIMTTE